MIALATKLQSFQEKRRFPNWKPQMAKSTYKHTNTVNERIIKRCLAFVDLELQVRDWVITQTGIDDETKAQLLRNSNDEDKHDEVLRYLRVYFGHYAVDQQARDIIYRWKSLSVAPIVAAYALEMGVFFSILPALVTRGDVYCAAVGTWINDDERVHVECNLAVMKELKLKLTQEVIQLVFDTVEYIFKPLGLEGSDKEARRAIKRLTTGKDKQMLIESLPVTTAFFEQDDRRSIVY